MGTFVHNLGQKRGGMLNFCYFCALKVFAEISAVLFIMLSKVIKQASIDHFHKWLERGEKFVIVSHVSPDGDAIGSSLGLWHFLCSQGKTANVVVPNAFPDFLKWMPGSKDILLYDRYREFANKLIAEADVIC